MKSLAGIATIVLAMAAAACTDMPAKAPINSDAAQRNWESRRVALSAVQSFDLQGRVAEGGLTGARGEIAWLQSGERFDIHVSGPLGVGALSIVGDPHDVEIRTKEGVFVTEMPETMMQERLGWSLPLSQLRYWVLGLPAPSRPGASPVLALDEDGRAVSITEGGWQVGYDEYRTVGALALPRKLSLVSGDRSFRMVIDTWSDTH